MKVFQVFVIVIIIFFFRDAFPQDINQAREEIFEFLRLGKFTEARSKTEQSGYDDLWLQERAKEIAGNILREYLLHNTPMVSADLLSREFKFSLWDIRRENYILGISQMSLERFRTIAGQFEISEVVAAFLLNLTEACPVSFLEQECKKLREKKIPFSEGEVGSALEKQEQVLVGLFTTGARKFEEVALAKKELKKVIAMARREFPNVSQKDATTRFGVYESILYVRHVYAAKGDEDIGFISIVNSLK